MKTLNQISIKVKLFAVYQETFEKEELILHFPPETPMVKVLDRLIEEKPELEKWREITRLGINLQFVEPNTILQDGDEVVLIPPVSGG